MENMVIEKDAAAKDELILALLEQIPEPVVLLRQADKPVLLNRRCELLIGLNARQLTYLNKIRHLTLRQWTQPDANRYHLIVGNSAVHYAARRISFAPEGEQWSLYSLAPPPAGKDAGKPELTFAQLVGRSKAFRDTVDACRRVEFLDRPALLCGESGTGKETLARAMHLEGPFPRENFICIQNNTEFTRFEQEQQANPAYLGGALHGHTLYVDEIANFNHHNQDLLFFLIRRSQGGEFKVICATSADLAPLIARGEWHRNLHDVLSAGRVEVPPLRRRREDIPLLAQHFLAAINRRTGRNLRFAQETLFQIRRYEWPGNLYELESFLMRAVRGLDEVDAEITPQMLETSLHISPERGTESEYSLRYAEKELILRALNDFSGDKCPKEAAARALGIGIATLYRKLAEYGIHRSNFYEV